MDLFVVPTISFRLLYGLLIMGLGRRQILWFGATAHPTAEWIANQLTQACGWEQTPRYLIRDRDGVYGDEVRRRLKSRVSKRCSSTSESLAECLCRALDRIDTKGVFEPLHHSEHSALEKDASCLFPPLPPIPSTFGAQQTMPD